MKTAYELAMERLNKKEPAVKLTAEKKAELAELDSIYAAKIAEREIALNDEMHKAYDNQDGEKYEELQKQLQFERQKLKAELEEKKERVRQGRN